MSELIEWLRAQIDEDERVARAIPVPEWAEDASWLTDCPASATSVPPAGSP